MSQLATNFNHFLLAICDFKQTTLLAKNLEQLKREITSNSQFFLYLENGRQILLGRDSSRWKKFRGLYMWFLEIVEFNICYLGVPQNCRKFYFLNR